RTRHILNDLAEVVAEFPVFDDINGFVFAPVNVVRGVIDVVVHSPSFCLCSHAAMSAARFAPRTIPKSRFVDTRCPCTYSSSAICAASHSSSVGQYAIPHPSFLWLLSAH